MIKLYHGKNTYISLREAKLYHKALLEGTNEVDDISIDADTVDASEVIQVYDTQGMFSQRKIIFIKRLNENKNSATLIEHISRIKTTSTDIEVIIWENKKIASNTKYYKFIKEFGEIFEAPELNKRTFMTWAKEELSRQSVDADSQALNELANRCNFDPERFSNEINKFKLLKDRITLDSVKAMTTDTFEADIWKLIDSINSGQKGESTLLLENLLRNKLDPHYILAMMYRNIRLIAQTKFLADRGEDSRSIASALKIPPFTVPSLIKSAARYDETKLKTIYERLTNLDHQIKVGEIEPQIGLTLITTVL